MFRIGVGRIGVGRIGLGWIGLGWIDWRATAGCGPPEGRAGYGFAVAAERAWPGG
jgi:hypothetical protein